MIIIKKVRIGAGEFDGDKIKTLRDAGWIRKKVIQDQDGKFPNTVFRNNLMLDGYDTNGYTTVLVAYLLVNGNEIPIASIRLIIDSKLGLPLVDNYNIDELRKKRIYQVPLCSVGMLVVDKKYQKTTRGLLLSMIRFLAAVAVEQGCKDIVATINFEIEKLMFTIGLKRFGDSFYSETVGNTIVPVYGTIEELEKVLHRRILPSEFDFLIGYDEIEEMAVYNKGEDLCEEGEAGDMAFFITEGRVGIFKKNGAEYKIASVGPGNIVGEMALLDWEDNKRCATIKAVVSGTEVLVLERDKLLQCMTDPAKTLAILAKLTERLCELNKKIKKTTIDQVEKAIPLPKKLKTQKKIKRVECEKDRIIITQGEFGDSAYIIKKGKVEVIVDGKTVAILSRGALFGEMAWLRKDMIRVATVVALEKTVLIKLEKDLMADIEFLKHFCLTMFLRIRKMNELVIATDEKKNLGKKLKETLLEIYSAQEMEKMWKEVTDLDEENRGADWVAERVGRPTEELRPYLDYLISQGIIKERDGGLIIADRKKLEEVIFKIDLTLA